MDKVEKIVLKTEGFMGFLTDHYILIGFFILGIIILILSTCIWISVKVSRIYFEINKSKENTSTDIKFELDPIIEEAKDNLKKYIQTEKEVIKFDNTGDDIGENVNKLFEKIKDLENKYEENTQNDISFMDFQGNYNKKMNEKITLNNKHSKIVLNNIVDFLFLLADFLFRGVDREFKRMESPLKLKAKLNDIAFNLRFIQPQNKRKSTLEKILESKNSGTKYREFCFECESPTYLDGSLTFCSSSTCGWSESTGQTRTS